MNVICGIFPDVSIRIIKKSRVGDFYSEYLKNVEYKYFLPDDSYFFSDSEVEQFFIIYERQSFTLKPFVIKASSKKKIWNEIKKLELLKEII